MPSIHPSHWKRILKVTRPEQEIGFNKLLELTGLGREVQYGALRHLRREGLVTVTMRRGHKDGSLVKFYAEPLPPEKRDTIQTLKSNHRSEPNYTVKNLYQIKAGTYTANELRQLARDVLEELGYKISTGRGYS